jgi:hypothetical protein
MATSAPSSSTPAFPTNPLFSIQLPHSPLLKSAHAYIQLHTTPPIANHMIRTALFALILRQKLPGRFSSVDPETVVLALLFHDIGWSKTAELVSEGRRFEVDGADVARGFVEGYFGSQSRSSGTEEEQQGRGGKEKWNEDRLEEVWYAIALHTTLGIAIHAPALTALTALAVQADFMGPNLRSPSDFDIGVPLITPAEFTEVVRGYPRLGFKEEMRGIMCGLCRSKPETTFDNFVGDYGKMFVEGYKERWAERSAVERLEGGLDMTVEFE